METTRKAIAAMFREEGSSIENAHVIVSNGHWKLVKEGNQRATAVFNTKHAAVEEAKKYGKSGNVKAIIIHNPDGTVQKRLYY